MKCIQKLDSDWNCSKCIQEVSKGEIVYHDTTASDKHIKRCKKCFGPEKLKEVAIRLLKGEDLYV